MGAGAGTSPRGREPRQRTRLWTLPEAPGLQLLRASFRNTSFPRHSHEGFGLGLVEQGVLGFDYRGASLLATPGSVNSVNPDEPHTGHGAGAEGWTYRMFYFGPEFLQRMAGDVAGQAAPLPFISAGVIQDPLLAALLARAHRLADPETGAGACRLGRESALLAAFARLLELHVYEPLLPPRAGGEHAAVARVQERLRADLSGELPLSELARAACLSPWHLIRVFARHTGLTPHAWLMQERARAAAGLLRRGASLAGAAAQAGFADQSHMTRVFRRLFGYTPGQLRNSVQNARPLSGV